MTATVNELEALKHEEEVRMKLLLYFTFTAHYIVAAMSYMRSDQV
jgi:hypothetical protein